ncbi:DUF871 domain-containing protein [Acetonema longum]|uniref:Outer surface protein n=1 Tax=Acetonema longum DSM 6540 TaxID=1009370 RepID=F7NMV1_9FIRM|nr:MupG family TIM beta-alpha barrel fold protein [Acetonema longum]EGO62645.1 outer surface protein [Acetonema longum DSM 6540]
MKQLGISVYRNGAPLENTLAYIDLAGQYGFKRIFTCLISAADRDPQDVMAEFKQMTSVAKKHGMEVIADVDPSIFRAVGANYHDLSFFYELGLQGIRLDLGFSGMEESIMTFNPYGLKVELNASNGTKYLDTVLSYKPNVDHILGCHNFYPHVYTGLGYEHFKKCSKHFKEHGIRTAAFVNSSAAEFGPWPVSEGLCTLEMHRGLPIETQVKHLLATGLIDDIIIANAFASEAELKSVSMVNKDMLEFSVELEKDIPALERTIVLDEFHFNRGDVSEYVIRSTQSRVKYKGRHFPPFHTPDLQRGDILIESSLYDRYAGELHIALQSMKNSGKTNVVGRIVDEEVFLLDLLEPWAKFKFRVKE